MTPDNLVRIYTMHPNPDRIDDFIAALRRLTAALAALPEFLGGDLLIGTGAFDAALFIERWQSRNAYQQVSRGLDRTLFRPLEPLLLKAPSVAEAQSVAL